MNDLIFLNIVFISGLALGTFFYGGLWFTVRQSVTSKMPAFWVFGSFIFRVSITMLGLYYISSGIWQRMLISLLGFISARYIVTHLTKDKPVLIIQTKKENHVET